MSNSHSEFEKEGVKICRQAIIASGGNFSGCTIVNADLSYASLEGSDFSYADLSGSSLRFCSFQSANLYKARLVGTFLISTDLSHTNLSFCNLSNTYLDYIKISNNIILTGVEFGHCQPAKKWTDLGLMPTVEGKILVWKHITRSRDSKPREDSQVYLTGHMGFSYQIGKEYICACMCTPGPMGAIKDWSDQSDRDLYILAILTDGLRNTDREEVYIAMKGVPTALYKVTRVNDEECLFDLVLGRDMLPYLE